MAPPQKLVLAPGATIRDNTVIAIVLISFRQLWMRPVGANVFSIIKYNRIIFMTYETIVLKKCYEQPKYIATLSILSLQLHAYPFYEYLGPHALRGIGQQLQFNL